MRKLTKDEFEEKMYRELSERLRLSDRQIERAWAAVIETWTQSPFCHADFGTEGYGRVYEVPDADTFAQEHVAAVDKNLLGGLEQYANEGSTHYVLFSSPFASVLWATGEEASRNGAN